MESPYCPRKGRRSWLPDRLSSYAVPEPVTLHRPSHFTHHAGYTLTVSAGYRGPSPAAGGGRRR